jgi:hypothetical protein
MKVIMGKVKYAIKNSSMPNMHNQVKLLDTFGTATSEKLEKFFQYPENSYFFILLIPLIRLLPIKIDEGGLNDDEILHLKLVFNYWALSAIKEKCRAKVTSKPLISINEFINLMQEELIQ